MDDAFDEHFALVISGGERTRGILYFYAIVMLVCVITSANNYFDTAGKRLTVINAAVACAQDSASPDKPVPLEKFRPETPEQGFCKFYYDYVERYYRLRTAQLSEPKEDPNSKTEQLPGPKEGLKKSARDEQLAALLEKRSTLLKISEENDFISVPILNFKVDANFEVQLQSLIASLVLFVLALSLSAEIKALRAAGPSAVNRSQAQLVLLSHVFLRPSKLNALLWLFLFLPFATEFSEALRDWDLHEDVLNKLYPGNAGLVFYGFEWGALSVCFALAATCFVLSWRLRSTLKTWYILPFEKTPP